MRQNYAKVRRLSERFDDNVTDLLTRCCVPVLRVNLGIVFLWFGALKFFSGLSPAEDLATRTISVLTFGLVAPHVSILILATWESLIGLGLIFGVCMRATLLLLFLQMSGTVTPLLFFPHEAFTHVPYAPTLEGQYIIKNLVLVSAGMLLWATMRRNDVAAANPTAMPARAGAGEPAIV